MTVGMGPGNDGRVVNGSVGNAAQIGGGIVTYDTGRSPLAARRTIGARQRNEYLELCKAQHMSYLR